MRSTPRDLALIAVFAALVAVLSLLAIPIGPVPITLQTLAVILAGTILGPVRGFAAVLLWIVVGLIGLPVFAGGTGGLAVLAGPTVGYLLSFPFAAALAGALVPVLHRALRRRALVLAVFCAGLAGIGLAHVAGVPGMMVTLDMPLGSAVVADLAFWPGDLIKNVIGALVAAAVFKAFPRIRADLRPVAEPAARR